MAMKKKAKGYAEPAIGYGPDKDWQAEDDMRTLARAEEIKRDRGRYTAAKKCARRKVRELEAISNGGKKRG